MHIRRQIEWSKATLTTGRCCFVEIGFELLQKKNENRLVSYFDIFTNYETMTEALRF